MAEINGKGRPVQWEEGFAAFPPFGKIYFNLSPNPSSTYVIYWGIGTKLNELCVSLNFESIGEWRWADPWMDGEAISLFRPC